MERSFLVRYRTRLGLIIFVLVLPLILFIRPAWHNGGYLDFALSTIGYALLVLGVYTRLWATLYIGGRKDREMQRTGPYSLVRHPLYAGSLMLGLGLSALSENPAVLLLSIAYFAIQYITTIRHEEKALAEMFGQEHAEYVRTTPCFIPRFSGFDPSPPGVINMRPLKSEAKHTLMALTLPVFLGLVDLLQNSGVLRHVKWP